MDDYIESHLPDLTGYTLAEIRDLDLTEVTRRYLDLVERAEADELGCGCGPWVRRDSNSQPSG